MSLVETDSKDYLKLMKNHIDFSFSLLDVGSGIGKYLDVYDCKVILALDVHRPYLENRETVLPHIIPLHANAMKLNHLFLPKTICTVLLSDTIEHFPKNDALELLRMAEEIAREKIVVFTPRGFFPQDAHDFYELHGEQYQIHKSGWEVQEFLDLGYDVTVLKEFHDARNPSFVKFLGAEHQPIDAILAVKQLKP